MEIPLHRTNRTFGRRKNHRLTLDRYCPSPVERPAIDVNSDRKFHLFLKAHPAQRSILQPRGKRAVKKGRGNKSPCWASLSPAAPFAKDGYRFRGFGGGRAVSRLGYGKNGEE